MQEGDGCLIVLTVQAHNWCFNKKLTAYFVNSQLGQPIKSVRLSQTCFVWGTIIEVCWSLQPVTVVRQDVFDCHFFVYACYITLA